MRTSAPSQESLRVINVDSGAVIATLFEAEGTLGSGARARMGEDGAFILELRMITGFDRAETRVVLWSAPNTDSGKGGYSRYNEFHGCWKFSRHSNVCPARKQNLLTSPRRAV